MIFELATTSLMGGLALKAFLSKNGRGNDSKKLNKIFTLSGLNVKHGSETFTTQLVKKRNYEWGSEYRYRIPLGRSFEDYVSKQKVIEAGLNTRSSKIRLKDLRKLKLDKNILLSIRNIYSRELNERKEIELSFDGLLSVKVYNNPMPDQVNYSKEFLKLDTWAVPIGINRTGVVYHDFDKSKHLIIAGVPGSGKSVVMKLIITILTLIQSKNVTFSLIDLKGGPAFARFKNLKQLKNLGIDNKQALDILKDVQKEMEDVYQNTLVPNGFEDVKEAGIPTRHFIVIDEAADLAGDNEAVEILTDIVRKGRGSGHYVIYATQYPTVQTVASQIKRNIPARLTYVLDSSTASMAVLDTKGAEELPEIPGRGIYKMVKRSIIQTPFIKNSDIDDLIKPFNIEKGGPKVEEVKRETRKNSFVVEKTRLP